MADETGLPEVPLAAGVVRLVLDESAFDDALERLAVRMEQRLRESAERALDAAAARLSTISQPEGPQPPGPSVSSIALGAGAVGDQVSQPDRSQPQAPAVPVFDDRVPEALREVLGQLLLIEAQVANVADALEIERNSL